MPKTCIVQYCGSVSRADSRSKGLTFHRLPVDDDLKQKWLDNIQRTNLDGSPWEPYKHATVCSRHFPSSSFHGPRLGPDAMYEEDVATSNDDKKKPMRRILYPNAIPTLHMGLKGQHKIVHGGPMVPSFAGVTLSGKKGRARPQTADKDIMKTLGISKAVWTRLQPQEKIEQRKRIQTWSTCLVDHSYSSTTLFGAEHLANENKHLKMQIEKLVHKYEAEKIKATRSQTALAKACSMLEQCSEYEFFDHEGHKIAKPRTGKKGKKPPPRITARHKPQADDRRKVEKVENCVVTPKILEEVNEAVLADAYEVNEDVMVETSLAAEEPQYFEYHLQTEDGEIYTIGSDDSHFIKGEDGTVFFEAMDQSFIQY